MEEIAKVMEQEQAAVRKGQDFWAATYSTILV